MNSVRINPRHNYPRLVACPGGIIRRARNEAEHRQIVRENVQLLLWTAGLAAVGGAIMVGVAIWQAFA